MQTEKDRWHEVHAKGDKGPRFERYATWWPRDWKDRAIVKGLGR